jgi:hypothetical protein
LEITSLFVQLLKIKTAAISKKESVNIFLLMVFVLRLGILVQSLNPVDGLRKRSAEKVF